MAVRPYKVIREVFDQARFMATLATEYPGYRMYLVEAAQSGPFQRANQYMLSREGYVMGQTLLINDDTELTMLKGNGPAFLSLNGNRVVVYRPERDMAQDFRIVSAVTGGDAVEKFGNGIDISRAHYYLYNAVRDGKNGYSGLTVRIFTNAAYAPGMAVPINETISLPNRTAAEPAYYLHDHTSKAYIDRLWRSIRNAAGGINPP